VRGIRVLDLSTDQPGAYCTRLLACVGADVVVAESPDGHPLRGEPPLLSDGSSAVWEYLQAYKALIRVEPGTPDAELVDGFDVVVLSDEIPHPDLAHRVAALRDAHPRVVVVAITGFGLTGPASGWRAGPLEHWAMGGHMALNGERDREPIPGGGPWVSRLVGATAAIGAQAAVVNSRVDGVGDVVDVGAMQALASCHQWTIVLYTHNGVLKERWGNRQGEQHHPLSLHPCADGWVCLGCVARHQWEGLCVAMDHVELLADDDLYTPAVRFDRADELDVLINGWTSQHTVAEVVAAVQANQGPAGPVTNLMDTLADPQLNHQEYWVPGRPGLRMPGVPFEIPGTTPAFRAAPREPEPGEPARALDLEKVRPLSGVKVVEFSIAWAGPLVGRFLADLGADVVKVEHPTARGLAMPDPSLMAAESASWTWGELPSASLRNGVFPDNEAGTRWWNRLGFWNKMNRGKRSLCLDVKAHGGREVLERLVATADVVFNNYSPRGVRSLEIDHETLRLIKPDLVTVDLSGYGSTGPDADKVSWGPILDASSGLASTTGYADSGPYKQGLAFPDVSGGLHGTTAVLAALWQRWITGEPVHVDLSQLETLLVLAGDQLLEISDTGEQPRRNGARSRFRAPSGVYRCAGEDDWAVLSVRSESDWRRLVGVIDELDDERWSDVEARLADHDRIDEIISRWTRRRSKHDVMATLQGHGLAASVVMTNVDLVTDSQLEARHFFVDLDQQDCGPQTFPGFPIVFDNTSVGLRPAPGLGADNDEVLAELGYSSGEIVELAASGAIADEPPD